MPGAVLPATVEELADWLPKEGQEEKEWLDKYKSILLESCPISETQVIVE